MARIGSLAYRISIATMATIIAVGFVGSLILTRRPGPLIGNTVHSQVVEPESRPDPDLSAAGPILTLGGVQTRSQRLPDRTVAFTFNDGPDPVWTPQILAVLRRYGVPATFFMVGQQVIDHPDVARAVVADGNQIGNLTFTRPDMGTLADWKARSQVVLAQRTIATITHTTPSVYRPPASGLTAELSTDELAKARAVANSTGLAVVLSDRLPADTDPTSSVDALVSQAIPPAGQGAVITFHDHGADQSNTVAALETTIKVLRDSGYRFARLDEVGATASLAGGAGVGDRLAGWFLVNGTAGVTTFTHLLWFASLALIVALVLRNVLVIALAIKFQRRHRRLQSEEPYLPPVTVIVPAYNEEVGIEAAVRSIINGGYPDLEVIVVDDGSSDRTSEIVAGLDLPGLRLVRQINQGKPVALRAGIAQASHEIVVMVDGDTIFEPRTIHALVQPFRDAEVAAVAGNAKVGNRTGLLARIQHVEYTLASTLDRRAFEELGTTGCIPGAIGAFRRHVLRDVGTVADDTLAEDADLTMAIARAGWKVAFAPDARAWTEVPTTYRGLYRQRLRWSYGTLQSIWKHRGSVSERGAAGRLGRRSIPFQLVYGYSAPLIAPAIDLLVLYQLLLDGQLRWSTLTAWLVMTGLMVAPTAYALWIDGERVVDLWVVPVQQVIYRPVLVVAVLRGVWAALIGTRLRWNKVVRSGNLSVGVMVGGEVIDLRTPGAGAVVSHA